MRIIADFDWVCIQREAAAERELRETKARFRRWYRAQKRADKLRQKTRLCLLAGLVMVVTVRMMK